GRAPPGVRPAMPTVACAPGGARPSARSSAHHAPALLVDPLAGIGRRVVAHPGEHRVDVLAAPQVAALVRMQEPLLDHTVDHADQRLVETAGVEEGAWLVADAQLAPGEHL